MNIKYLGTAAAEGWPGLFCRCELCVKSAELGGKNIRTRSQALIDNTLLVDFPPDSYLHMIHSGLNLPEIQNIIITHSHQDHFYPLDLTMRGKGFSDNVKGILNVYGNGAVYDMYNSITKNISPSWQLDQRIKLHRMCDFDEVSIGDHKVTALAANHDKKENCLTFLIESKNKALLYANDTGLLPEASYQYLKGKKLDLVSMDCTMIQHKDGSNHMGLPDNAIMRKRLEELNCIQPSTTFVITHFSHHGGLLHDELEAVAVKTGFITAYDGMLIDF